MKKKAGFTLIELLVVISIIALLLSIVVPSLRRARQLAQAVVCRSNLRQMGIGLQTYYVDNNHKSLSSAGGEDFWFLQIAPYMGDTHFQPGANLDPEATLSGTMQTLKCPGTLPPQTESGAWVGTARHQYRYHVTNVEGGYAINAWAGGWDALFNSSRGYVDSATASANYRKSFRENGFRRGDVPVIADGIWVDAAPQDTDTTPDQWPAGIDLTTGHRLGDYNAGEGLGRLVTNRHGMRTNILFGDGHVDDVPLDDMWRQRWHREFKARSDVQIQPRR